MFTYLWVGKDLDFLSRRNYPEVKAKIMASVTKR